MDFRPNQHPVLFALVAILLVVFVNLCRRAFFHPLSSYPGPWLSKFSDILSIVAVVKRDRAQMQYRLLQEYGSPVRMGPNALLFSDMSALTDIYGQSSKPCLKDDIPYKGLSTTGAINILNAQNREQHARLRRLISHSFSLKSLLGYEAFILSKVDQYLSIFPSKSKQPVDILHRTYSLMLDIVSHISFGESFDCLNGRNPTAQSDVLAFFTVIPPLASAPVLRYFPIKSIQEGRKGLARLQEFSRAHVEAYVSQSVNKEERGSQGHHFLQNMASALDAETGTKLTKAELEENAIIFLVAGSGTTAATLIYLMWECGRHPEVQKRLIREIRDKFPDSSVRPSYEEASKLKFLNCVIEETLRLRGPLNGGARRVSPGKVIAGHWVPKGVVVAANLYTAARDPTVFHEPLKFNPSRWEQATDEMRQMAKPFSIGPRNCVGRHLAEINLILTVACLYQAYDIVPDPSLTEARMKQIDLGVLEPGCEDFFVSATAAQN